MLQEVIVMKAIVGTDGSPCSQVAIDLVGWLAWPQNTTLRVVSALDPLELSGLFVGFAAVETTSFEADIKQELEARVEAAAQALTGPGRMVEHRVVSGRPATAVCEQARTFGADIIAVGSRGRGPIESMMLGSVSAEIVGHAPCPVLVARGREVRRILFAYDGSDQANRAEDLLATWPMFAGARVDVVSVSASETNWDDALVVPFAQMRPPVRTPASESLTHHRELARSSAERLGRAGSKVDWTVCTGDAAHGILNSARQYNSDLVVMGTRGLTGLRRLMLGSVARNVVTHAHCSVLVVPPAT
jgi:nucleotide-binding universal stress UspA family protein